MGFAERIFALSYSLTARFIYFIEALCHVKYYSLPRLESKQTPNS